MIYFTEEAVLVFNMRAWAIHLQEGTAHTGLLKHHSSRDNQGAFRSSRWTAGGDVDGTEDAC